MWNWFNWLMVRPERMVVTLLAVYILGVVALLYEMYKSPFSTPSHVVAYSKPYVAEVHEAWQANCERLREPGRQCGD